MITNRFKLYLNETYWLFIGRWIELTGVCRITAYHSTFCIKALESGHRDIISKNLVAII